ncbi:hypothetical protein [Wuhan heteroptera virus 1]|uniref:hypothetical protein n=1 Tax=Wuhan heteroptera virus 1 TaxID=1923701 RepID=UPI00090B904B|nr:hypothetical protein [Wuhan heteroptera virus 1]APG77538.1 hypothetical protein [Wuhan heteroptera virus 1]APG77793.1 hypothetical protein [Wuhan heteroptera virus 1]
MSKSNANGFNTLKNNNHNNVNLRNVSNLSTTSLNTSKTNNNNRVVRNVLEGGPIRRGGQKFGENVSNAFFLMITNLTQSPLLLSFYIYINLSLLTTYFTRTSMIYTMFLKFILGRYTYPFPGLIRIWYYYISLECNNFYWFIILSFIGIIFLLKPSNKNFVFCLFLFFMVVGFRIKFIDILVLGNLLIWVILFRSPSHKTILMLGLAFSVFIRLKFDVAVDYYPQCYLCNKTFALKNNNISLPYPTVFPLCYNVKPCSSFNGGDLALYRYCGGCPESPFAKYYNIPGPMSTYARSDREKACNFNTSDTSKTRKRYPVPDDFYEGIVNVRIYRKSDGSYIAKPLKESIVILEDKNVKSVNSPISTQKPKKDSTKDLLTKFHNFIDMYTSTPSPLPAPNPVINKETIQLVTTETPPTTTEYIPETTTTSLLDYFTNNFRLPTVSTLGFNTTSTNNLDWLFNYIDSLAYYKPPYSDNYILMENTTHIVPFKLIGVEDVLEVHGLGQMRLKSSLKNCGSYLIANKEGKKTLETVCPT